jgi:hypothetical protein
MKQNLITAAIVVALGVAILIAQPVFEYVRFILWFIASGGYSNGG